MSFCGEFAVDLPVENHPVAWSRAYELRYRVLAELRKDEHH